MVIRVRSSRARTDGHPAEAAAPYDHPGITSGKDMSGTVEDPTCGATALGWWTRFHKRTGSSWSSTLPGDGRGNRGLFTLTGKMGRITTASSRIHATTMHALTLKNPS
jgi:hypothetical protein